MELERALFRIYERALAPFADELVFANAQGYRPRGGMFGSGKRLCLATVSCSAVATLLSLVGFLSLHTAFVYQPGCAYTLLNTAVAAWAADSNRTGVPGNSSASSFVQPSDVLRIGVDWARQGCPFNSANDGADGAYWGCVMVSYGPPNTNWSSFNASTSPPQPYPPPLVYFTAGAGGSSSGSGGATDPSGMDPTATPGAGYISDYLFAPTAAGMALALQSESDVVAQARGVPSTSISGSGWLPSSPLNGFRRISIVLPPSCPGAASSAGTTGGGNANGGWGRDVLSVYDLIVGSIFTYDTILLNDLQWGWPDARGGYLRNTYTGEDWTWSTPRDDLIGLGFQSPTSPAPAPSRPYDSFSFSVRWDITIRLAVLGFFCLTVINALLVRILFSSGVAVMYCLAWIVSRCVGRDRLRHLYRQLNIAYPWLGIHVGGLMAAGAPASPLLWSNALFSLLAFVLYECSAAALNPILFGWKSFPSSLAPTLWTIFGLTECFSYVFLRSKRGLTAFPRAVLLLWLLWCWYYAATPYGFAVEAAAVMGLAFLTVGLLVLWQYEVPALAQEKVHDDRPRELMVMLGQREVAGIPGAPHGMGTPPLWTIVHPLQNLEPPEPQQQQGGQGGAAGGVAGAGLVGHGVNAGYLPPGAPVESAAIVGAAGGGAAAAAVGSGDVAVSLDSSGDRDAPLLGADNDGGSAAEGEESALTGHARPLRGSFAASLSGRASAALSGGGGGAGAGASGSGSGSGSGGGAGSMPSSPTLGLGLGMGLSSRASGGSRAGSMSAVSGGIRRLGQGSP